VNNCAFGLSFAQTENIFHERKVAYRHAGLTHFGGAYFLHEFMRVLQMREFLGRHLAYQRRNSDYRTATVLKAGPMKIMKIHRLLQKSFREMHDFVQIHKNRFRFTPDSSLSASKLRSRASAS
jgi:hypothetical protein